LIKTLVNNEKFYIADFVTALISGAIWILMPQVGGWPILIALLPCLVRLRYGIFSLPNGLFLLGILIYLITAVVGYRVSFDSSAAQSKFWAIISSVFLCYAIANQPRRLAGWLAGIFFALGVFASLYFFSTHNFVDEPRRIAAINTIGAWWMVIRPSLSLPAVHPNYIAGISAITSLFGVYPLFRILRRRQWSLKLGGIIIGFVIVFSALIASTSRGVWMAIVVSTGIYFLYFFLRRLQSYRIGKAARLFPAVVLLYLLFVVILVYKGPAQFASDPGIPSNYGTDSRAELLERGFELLADFPVTGSGLGSFAGLYSYYILSIPFFYLPNSHNIFLDVSIEQGILAGVAFVSLFLGSIWAVSRRLVEELSLDRRIFLWLTLFALVIAVIHEMVDDYLYYGKGAILSLILVGTAIYAIRNDGDRRLSSVAQPIKHVIRFFQNPRKLPAFLTIVGLIIFVGIGVYQIKAFRAIWYSNLGALRLARYDLTGFLESGPGEAKNSSDLALAESAFYKAVALDPDNFTAHHRLGLIAMRRKDYHKASEYLVSAYRLNPNHRGAIKNLGYTYVWLSEYEKAGEFFQQIPEASDELEVYSWWWETQGDCNLAMQAKQMAEYLSSEP
jgi:O-antigen ligase